MFAMILTAVCVLLVIALLLLTDTSTDLIFGLAIVILITFGVINTQQAFVGFVNEGFLTIAALYVVASGLVRSGAAFSLTQNIFGQTSNLRWAQVRMSTAVALLSAVLNNTAVIAALLANVRDWARTHKIPQSQMLMPMSYAAMLG
ncbi:MAG: SLC13 family permease, partial [Gammaproteobacteria bacterium]|nr:SLC13 family permease [Gammaproteobacteria bacterium]